MPNATGWRGTWIPVDHLCRHCGGRILKSLSGQGATPGGNPVFRCSCCGRGRADMGPDGLCWCGFTHRGQPQTQAAYTCLPYSILQDVPSLLDLFRSCGCDPETGTSEVGIVLESDLQAVRKKADAPK